MYWVLDIHKYRKGFPHVVEDTLYFKEKKVADVWVRTFNSSCNDKQARDLRQEGEEAVEVVLNNYFKSNRNERQVTQKVLEKFCLGK